MSRSTPVSIAIPDPHEAPPRDMRKLRRSNGRRSSALSPMPISVDRDAVFLGQRHQHAALGGAVELGHDDAGDADHLAEDLGLGVRVLPDRRVEHQQHRMRRRRVELLQRRARSSAIRPSDRPCCAAARRCRSAACRRLRARLDQRVVGEPGRVRAGAAGSTTGQPARSPQICSCSTAAARNVSPAASTTRLPGVAVLPRELADRRRLAAAVDADDEDHERLFRRVERAAASAPARPAGSPRRRARRGPPRARPPG